MPAQAAASANRKNQSSFRSNGLTCKTTLATRPSNRARDRTAQLDLSKPSAPTVRLHTEIVATRVSTDVNLCPEHDAMPHRPHVRPAGQCEAHDLGLAKARDIHLVPQRRLDQAAALAQLPKGGFELAEKIPRQFPYGGLAAGPKQRRGVSVGDWRGGFTLRGGGGRGFPAAG